MSTYNQWIEKIKKENKKFADITEQIAQERREQAEKQE